MKANIEIICYKYKPLKDGTLPLMLRVTKDRNAKYVSLGLSCTKILGDFEKSKPKRNCPNKAKIERLIAAKTAEYNDLIVEMTPSNVNTRWKRSCPIFITKSVALRWSNCTIN